MLSSTLYDIVPLTLFLYILGMLFMSCSYHKIHSYSNNRRRNGLGCHIWSRRRIFWRHAGVSRELYIIYALNNRQEKLIGTCSESCSKISKPLCGGTRPCSSPVATLTGKTKCILFRTNGSCTVKPLPFITIPKRSKKRNQFRRKSGSSFRSSVFDAPVDGTWNNKSRDPIDYSDNAVEVRKIAPIGSVPSSSEQGTVPTNSYKMMTKKMSRRKKASSLTGQTKFVRFRKNGSCTVKLLPFITIPKRSKKLNQFR